MNSFVNQFLAFHSIFGHENGAGSAAAANNAGGANNNTSGGSSSSADGLKPSSAVGGDLLAPDKDAGTTTPSGPRSDGEQGSCDSMDPPPIGVGVNAAAFAAAPPQRKRFRVAVEEEEGLKSGNKVFTDDIDDLCQCTCKICFKSMTSKSLKEHIRKQHKMGPEEYISRYGEIHYTKLTYHRCQLCKRTLKAVVNVISNHLKKCHNINFQEYRTKFNVFNGVHTGKRKFFIKKNSVGDNSNSEHMNSLEKFGKPAQPTQQLTNNSRADQIINITQQQLINNSLKQAADLTNHSVSNIMADHSVSNIMADHSVSSIMAGGISKVGNSGDNVVKKNQDDTDQQQVTSVVDPQTSEFLRSFYFNHFMTKFRRLNDTMKRLSSLSEENKLELYNTEIVNNSAADSLEAMRLQIGLVEGKHKEPKKEEEVQHRGGGEQGGVVPALQQQQQHNAAQHHMLMSLLEDKKIQGNNIKTKQQEEVITTSNKISSLDLQQRLVSGLAGGLDLSSCKQLPQQQQQQGMDLTKQQAAAMQGLDLGLQGLQGVQQWMLNLQNGFHPAVQQQQVEEGVDQDGRVYTNNVKEFCVAQCNLCNKKMTIKSLREHVRHRHNQSIREYKKKYGDMCYTKITYHRCKFCCKSMKASVSTISTHLKKQHSVSFQQYRAIFKIFQDVKRRRRL